MSGYTVTPIGYIQSCFTEKFGIPRQPLLAPSATAMLTLEPPFNHPDTVLGLESVSHIWLSFIFHRHVDTPWKEKVRPPRLGGNKKIGVFATRSSFRPNHLGLSVVKLERIDCQDQRVTLYLSGVDLLDGTPIVDIKPYVPYVDQVPHAENAFADKAPSLLTVTFHQTAQQWIDREREKMDGYYGDGDEKNVHPDQLRTLIIEVLQQDPRPAYQAIDDSRVYGMTLFNKNIQWVYRQQGNDIMIVVTTIETINSGC